jgi:hypothetical protein
MRSTLAPARFNKNVRIMRRFELTRLQRFCSCLILGIAFYLIDCVLASINHPDVPWFERGVYAGGLAGFYWTVIVVLVGFGFLIFGKNK